VLAREDLPPGDARVFTDGAAPTLVLASDLVDVTALPSGMPVARWNAADGIAGALRALGDHGIGELLVEPGPRLLSAMWRDGAVDEYVTVVAGGMGGVAVPVFLGEGDRRDDALMHRFKPLEAGIVGDVSVTIWGPDESADIHTERT
jgi:riboflavin biosynthesis pyrimidine reductase